ncbi:LysM peptidoglycan-binding domain-containing protein [Agromyces fucosus]|uniref:LysM peptidoglycan-binding domain-containing protein n=1 Tax=Agromyces fucosus TaxID=41985 RepID=A0A4Q2JJQ6_9MICO|nr:LysM peptidoglycan-binding domain-containing protein [Agromyces fucosus]RXZ46347.1 LysM peptidoglycan-binding domain-containing protein [Agromyces fucosus]
MSAAIATTGFQASRALPRDFDTSVRAQGVYTQTGVAHAPSAVVRTRLRLTRRGRVVFTMLAALPLVVWVLVLVLGSGAAAADVDSAGATFEYVTVGQGDSLWAIAEAIDPSGDVREVIAEIVRLNGLDDAVVEPGQRLALPLAP